MLICEEFANFEILVMQLLQKSDRPTVQLLHKMPDGSSHIDWMMAQDDSAQERELITFRLSGRLDKVQKGQSILAQRIKNHRLAYLEYEGPISSDRGVVNRVAKGVILSEKRDESSWRVEICWESDSSSVIHQKFQMQEIQNPQGKSTVIALCESLEIIEK